MTGDWFGPAFGAHYPVLYAHRDEAEAARCLDLLPRLASFGSAGRERVLDLGCGDGRHLELLTRRGVSATGLDLSSHLLAAARERFGAEEAPELVRGDMRRIPFAAEAFTAVLSLFTAFGYFSSDEDNRQPVKEISRVLKVGGHWFLDYLDGDAVRAEVAAGGLRRRREAGPLVVDETRRLAAGPDRVLKAVRLAARPGREAQATGLGVGPEGLAYEESVRLFSRGELDGMAAAAGLRRVAAAGGYGGESLGEGSRWILVYRRERKEAR